MTRGPRYEIGLAKADLTVFEPGMVMLGWGHPDNVSEGVAMPLWARAVVFADPATGAKLAYVCADLCLISLALRRAVMSRLRRTRPDLGLDEHNVMLTATHTHSGPNGYGGHLYLDISGPGLSDKVLALLVDQIVSAIVEADRRRAPGDAYYTRGEIPLDLPMMFNRSIDAYNRNTDVRALPRDRRDEAVDRAMRLLRFDDANGRPIGALVWLALHNTTIHFENRRLHPDHSGIAAKRLEERVVAAGGAPEFVAIFAQEASGDVTPNYRDHRARGLRIGRHDDDFASAAYCGEAEARIAARLLEGARRSPRLDGPLRAATRYVRVAERELGQGADGPRRTTRAHLGLAMALGTEEGPGPLAPLAGLVRLLRDRRQGAGRDVKVPFVSLGDGGRGRVFGAIPVQSPWLTALPLPAMSHFRRLALEDALGDEWIPSVVPLQLVQLGGLRIAGLPCEPTVVAGRRLRATIAAASESPVVDVVVNGYANAYCLYLVTPEEYDEQHYEAACTLFGRWTLVAYQEAFFELAAGLPTPRARADLGDPVPATDLRYMGVGRYAGLL